MGRNKAKDALAMAAKDQRILDIGFHIFSRKTIEKVKMTDIADEAGIGVATLYRYYRSKAVLVIAVATHVWEEYTAESRLKLAGMKNGDSTGAEEFAFFLERFLDLYRNHPDLLRFNQFFNVYIQSEDISEEVMEPYTRMISALEEQFGETWRKGGSDGTLRTDMPEKKMFSHVLHLMLAAVTRYAVGLAYNIGTDPEEELTLLKEMLLARFVA